MNIFRRKNKKTESAPNSTWMGQGMGTENSLERGMEKVLQGNIEKKENVSDRIARIEAAVERLGKHYEEYEDIVKFVRYLGATERLFLQAGQGGEVTEETKRSIVENDIRSVAESMGIEPEFFETIQKEFRLYQSDASTLYKIAQELSEKHADCPECIRFIYYVRDMYAMLLEDMRRGEKPVFLKERIIKAHMEIICSDGHPKLAQLQDVYREFCAMLGRE